MAEDESREEPFDRLIERLERTVERLEAPDLALEEALSLYEEGVAVLRRCLERLKAAEGKVEMLREEGERLLGAVPFEPAPPAEEEEDA